MVNVEVNGDTDRRPYYDRNLCQYTQAFDEKCFRVCNNANMQNLKQERDSAVQSAIPLFRTGTTTVNEYLTYW
jgi:hypothetical protein